MRLAVLIPVYNNAASVAELISRVVRSAETCCSTLEVWCVEVGRSDARWRIMCPDALRESGIKFLRLWRNFGQYPHIIAAPVHAREDAYI